MSAERKAEFARMALSRDHGSSRRPVEELRLQPLGPADTLMVSVGFPSDPSESIVRVRGVWGGPEAE